MNEYLFVCMQVRETETWMPPKAEESHGELDSSGDFVFSIEDSTTIDDEDEGNYEDTEDYDDMSGSGDDKSLVYEDSVIASEVGDPAYKSIK